MNTLKSSLTAVLAVVVWGMTIPVSATPIEVSISQTGSNSGSFSQISPTATNYTLGVDFDLFSTGFLGSATGFVDSVANTATGGCSASDFSAFTSGSIALVRDTVCFFSDSINNAAAAGAIGVLIIPILDVPTPRGLVDPVFIPSMVISQALGAEFEAILATPVPVPPTLALLGLGLGLLGISRRRLAKH